MDRGSDFWIGGRSRSKHLISFQCLAEKCGQLSPFEIYNQFPAAPAPATRAQVLE